MPVRYLSRIYGFYSVFCKKLPNTQDSHNSNEGETMFFVQWDNEITMSTLTHRNACLNVFLTQDKAAGIWICFSFENSSPCINLLWQSKQTSNPEVSFYFFFHFELWAIYTNATLVVTSNTDYIKLLHHILIIKVKTSCDSTRNWTTMHTNDSKVLL